MNKTLVLIRHGHRDTTDRAADNGLSEKGRDQARSLRRFGEARFPDPERTADAWLVCSPKLRCRETLTPIARAFGRVIDVHPELDEAAADEAASTFDTRVRRFVDEWARSAPSLTVACGHGDWLPRAVHHALGFAPDRAPGVVRTLVQTVLPLIHKLDRRVAKPPVRCYDQRTTDYRDPRRNEFISADQAAYNPGRGEDMIRHIDAELQGLKDLALRMGTSVERALESACQGVLAHARGGEACRAEVNVHETQINELQMEIDEACVNVLAKQAPVAKDLRLVIAITRINTDLERMGDQSVNIARSACELYNSFPQALLPAHLGAMVDEVRAMVRAALDAFARRDVALSHQVLQMDDKVDAQRDTLFRDMIERMKLGPDHVEVGLAFIMIAKNLERLADHATNIAEEVIYLATGNDVRHGHTFGTNS